MPTAAKAKAAKANESEKLPDDANPTDDGVVARAEDGASIPQQGSQTVSRDSGDAIGGAEITGRQLARDEAVDACR